MEVSATRTQFPISRRVPSPQFYPRAAILANHDWLTSIGTVTEQTQPVPATALLVPSSLSADGGHQQVQCQHKEQA